MPIKAQPQESPTLSSRAPTTLPQAKAEGRHAHPRPRPGEEEKRPGRPGGLTATSQLGRCLLIEARIVLACSTAVSKSPKNPAVPNTRDQPHIVHAFCPRHATGTYPQLLNHSVPQDYQVSPLILSCRVRGKRLPCGIESVTTGRVCEKQDSAAFVRYHENPFCTSALLRPQ